MRIGNSMGERGGGRSDVGLFVNECAKRQGNSNFYDRVIQNPGIVRDDKIGSVTMILNGTGKFKWI